MCCPFCRQSDPKREKHGYNVEGGPWDEEHEETEFEFPGVGFICRNRSCKKFFLVQR